MTTLEKFPVLGRVAAGFEPVREAFTANFTRRGEVGAALHVTVGGDPVVDLWGGATDAAKTRPWNPGTLVNVWSTTKGWLALAMHILACQGLLDFDAPVARYWPEFAQKEQGCVTVRHLVDPEVIILGDDYAGIGTDFDGGGGVTGCSDVSQMFHVTMEMLRRGYSEKTIRKIWGGNAMRVLQKTIDLAAAPK